LSPIAPCGRSLLHTPHWLSLIARSRSASPRRQPPGLKAMNLAADRGLSICGHGGCTETDRFGVEMDRMKQVADGVWVRQSEWVWTNSIVVRGEDGLILIDPGIHGSELNALADDLDRLGIPVVAGFSTHPHTDHLLW